MKVAHVKRAFTYRFYPTDARAAELSRTFGCVRKVYNPALAARTQAWARQERVNYNQTSAMLTAWKKTEELAYLGDVSSVPLPQALRHLQTAFTNFFAKRATYPRFRSRKKSRKSAEYTTSAFRFRDGKLTLANMAEPLDIVWSRPLPEGAARSEFRSMLGYKAQWYGREVIAADRWFPSSKLCSTCRSLRGTMPLNVRTWACDCGTAHDRDVNAAKNILAAGLAVSVCGAGVRPQRRTPGGQSATKQKPLRREP